MADEEPVFRMGLALAGAISAGAYSAGVVDFIVEALDAYEAARTTGQADGEPWTGPTHAVRVPVITGASAGGMTAAMAALQLQGDFEHLGPGRRPTEAARNRLYAGWVDEIDIEPLLDTRDLDAGQRLRSVLSCRVLDDIVGRTLAIPLRAPRAWLGQGDSRALAVLLTVSDTGGVPYGFRVDGGGKHDDYAMLNHGSSMRFVLGRRADLRPAHEDFDFLDIEDGASPVLRPFGQAALATGAFPIGLAARQLDRPLKTYLRIDDVGTDIVTPDGVKFVPTPPLPPPEDRPDRHRFIAVDGGVINNEPLELARRFLNGRPEKNPLNRNGEKTSYAVVLIDPFPNREVWPDEPGTDAGVLSVVSQKLVGMLIDQARFKPQELTLALDETVFSRFAILPEPQVLTPASSRLPIACGALGGFSGFLDRSFRHHDYCLGRRNAQAFLRNHFCLPRSNDLFKPWIAAGGDERAWYIDGTGRPGGGVRTVAETVRTDAAPEPNQVPALPIIPLTRRLREEIRLGAEDRPRIPDERALKRLEDRLDTRLGLVIERFVDQDIRDLVPLGWIGRQALKRALPGVGRRKAMNMIRAAVDQIRTAFP